MFISQTAKALGLALLLGCALTACSSNGEEDVIHDGTSASGDDGTMTVSFTSTPSPPAIGSNDFLLTVKDTKGEPMIGYAVQAEVFPPGSDTSDDQNPVVTDNKDGTYAIKGVAFSKPGRWAVKFHVERDSPQFHDHAKFGFDVK